MDSASGGGSHVATSPAWALSSLSNRSTAFPPGPCVRGLRRDEAKSCVPVNTCADHDCEDQLELGLTLNEMMRTNSRF